ncbi:MAG: hypothetical protein EPN93_10555 [Spirochaetes bacterium]|nr:MAG: hypothetical protein EPN93_10555 [Spirochaetota bacterium]
MSEYIWLIATYASIGIFALGMAVRVVRIARLPLHLRWELAPVPHERDKHEYGGSFLEEPDWWMKPRERSRMNELLFMLKEIFFLHAVRKNNRRIWPFSLAFHTGLYCLFFMACLLVASAAMSAAGYAAPAALIETPAGILGGAAYLLGSMGALGMLVLRGLDRDLRSYSGLPAYLNLAVLFVLFASGGFGMIIEDGFIGEMQRFINAAMLARPGLALYHAAAIHLGAGLFFLALLPFTSMVHFAAKFFTYHTVLWDDRRMDAAMEKEVGALLGQPVGWKSSHLGADGTKNWIDVVKGE